MKIILGISDGDDAGAVILKDGKLESAVNEERFNRMKMSIGFPKNSINQVLSLSGVEAKDVFHVAMAANTEKFIGESIPNKGWFQESSSISRIRNEISSALSKPLGGFNIALKSHYQMKRVLMGFRKSKVKKILNKLNITASISYHDHHRCHAFAAFDTSGFTNALSISLDGGGDGCSSHVYAFENNKVSLLNKLSSFHSIGNYYAYVTHLCGFRASIHEGKITGLAASGSPIYKDIFERLIIFKDGNIVNTGKLFFNSAISYLQNNLPQDWEHKDLASSIQHHLEDVVLKYVRYWLQRSKLRKLCVSGGVFANVILNQRIAELPECEELYVFPAMGDGGLAAGSAYCAYRNIEPFSMDYEQRKLDHVYLGPSFDDGSIKNALVHSGLPFTFHENIEEVVAHLVADGRVVARFNDAMEFGPRALGNRSILYKTDEPAVNTWLNKRLNRTEFMPFAPICLHGHEQKLFDWNPAVEPCAGFMTITQNCTPWMKNKCPAVVHIDGTARPQIVKRETNPSMYEILNHYYHLTGVPVLVNTSFNMHEEPIVCTPSDAIRSFSAGRLDNLAIGNFLLKNTSAE
jgi:carbamoyltransferase